MFRSKESRNTTSWRCSPIQAAIFIWGTSVTTRSATLLPAISGRVAIRSCTQWVGMHSAFRPKMPRANAASIPRSGRAAISRRCAANCSGWPVHRLDPRVRDLRPVLLWATAETVLDLLRAGLADRRQSWVNWDPGRPDRAGERAGCRRPGMAVGRGRREAAVVAVVLPHHRSRAGIAGGVGFSRPVAGAGPDHAGALDRRSEGAKIRFALDKPAAGATTVEVYTTRPDTLFGMSFLAIAPEHPIAIAVAEANADAAAFVAECRAFGDERGCDRRCGEAGLRHRADRVASVRPGPPGGRSGSRISC